MELSSSDGKPWRVGGSTCEGGVATGQQRGTDRTGHGEAMEPSRCRERCMNAKVLQLSTFDFISFSETFTHLFCETA